MARDGRDGGKGKGGAGGGGTGGGSGGGGSSGKAKSKSQAAKDRSEAREAAGGKYGAGKPGATSSSTGKSSKQKGPPAVGPKGYSPASKATNASTKGLSPGRVAAALAGKPASTGLSIGSVTEALTDKLDSYGPVNALSSLAETAISTLTGGFITPEFDAKNMFSPDRPKGLYGGIPGVAEIGFTENGFSFNSALADAFGKTSQNNAQTNEKGANRNPKRKAKKRAAVSSQVASVAQPQPGSISFSTGGDDDTFSLFQRMLAGFNNGVAV